MQVYGRGQKKFLEIGVADYGDGLAATLARNPKNRRMASDLEAIHYATRLGTSAYDDPTRGTGLYHLLELAFKHGGSVQIRSGQAKIRYRADQQKVHRFVVPHVRGVQIALTLRARTRA